MTVTETRVEPTVGLRRGDRVRLKPLAEIEATLDAEGRTEMLPFQREMLAYRGRVLEIASRSDKTCDTINLQGCDREMSDTVHVAGARCDGSAHGGCQAYCLLFFKEAWLEPVPDGEVKAKDVSSEEVEAARLADRLDSYADAGPNHYRCQATQLLEATRPLKPVRHYLTDLRTRNVPLGHFVHGVTMAAVNMYQMLSSFHLPKALRYRDGHRLPDMRGPVRDNQWPAYEPQGLKAGDLVEIRSKDEIVATLDAGQRNRGLWCDEEMASAFGKRGRIVHKVERLIDEKTGRMLSVKKDLFIVAGMVCEGTYHKLCTRAVMSMMRESWLRRVD